MHHLKDLDFGLFFLLPLLSNPNQSSSPSYPEDEKTRDIHLGQILFLSARLAIPYHKRNLQLSVPQDVRRKTGKPPSSFTTTLSSKTSWQEEEEACISWATFNEEAKISSVNVAKGNRRLPNVKALESVNT